MSLKSAVKSKCMYVCPEDCVFLHSFRHDADIQLSSFKPHDHKTTMNNVLSIPNFVTYNNVKSLPTSVNKNYNRNSVSPIFNYNLRRMTCHLSSSSKIGATCRRLKDWIAVTASSTALYHNSTVQSRCLPSMNVAETTPILEEQKQHSHNSPLSNPNGHLPRVEQLCGPTLAPNSAADPHQQLLLVDDHFGSVRNLPAIQRSSICSMASSTLTNRFLHAHRPSTSSSLGASSQQGVRKHPRLHDGMSQASFQMISLDTEDSSSGSSSLTHQSTTIQTKMSGVATSISPSSDRKHLTVRNLTKFSAANERKAMRVLLIIFSIFVILWTPFFVMNLISCFVNNMHPVFISVATWLGYCSSGANPVIYTIFSRTFRRAFINILTGRKVTRSHRSQILGSSYHSMTMPAAQKMSIVSKGQVDAR